ncbi:helix-turn-helix domain-containing protein [Kurthia gibsonii]|uniref:helix-turn-helix domain-containing protein n=1 Tax=Kurthia gibsonii TaxID=33946 RepID=UPI0030CE3E19
MNSLHLTKTNLSELAKLTIGMRIRYIRELLQNEFGNDFSGKSLANRLQLFSQSTLTMIERGKTKDISAQALYAIANDFGADIYLFFDDYYQKPNNKDLVLRPTIYNDDTKIEAKNESIITSETNPLQENEYKIRTTISKIASNQDEQFAFTFTSQEKYSKQELFQLIATVINQINLLDVSINSDAANNDAIKLSKDFIYHSEASLKDFPWYPNKQKVSMENELHEVGIKHTDALLEELKTNPEYRGE